MLLRRHPSSSLPRSGLSCGALRWSARGVMNIGGRKSRSGFSQSSSRSPQVKQGPALGVPRRIPGTTKVRYTNEKGRSFSFSIPVAQLTHPPTVREGASAGGWRQLDTSYCDTGEVEEDMPSPVQDYLRKHTMRAAELGGEHLPATMPEGADDEDEGWFVRLDGAGLEELQSLFVTFCRDYVLMDTQGMKTSLTYAELNNGPDYEMYDRKSMRKRYWLAIRHQYEDIKELLWPSTLLTAGAAPEPLEPALSAEAMMEALVWLEAASTFCVRRRQPYDLAAEEEFLPLDLSREVRVLAARVRSCPDGATFFTPLTSAARPGSEGGTAAKLTPGDMHQFSDRFISCAALCAKYAVPFSSFLSSTATPHATSPAEGGEAAVKEGVRSILLALPDLRTAKDAVRVMGILDAMTTAGGPNQDTHRRSHTARSDCYVFSQRDSGRVLDEELCAAIARLCNERLFGASDALANVAEAELCVILGFVVHVHEQNPSFFSRENAPLSDTNLHSRTTLEAFTKRAVARCRHLLYRADGPQTGVMSGDDEFVPFVEMQRNSERSHPEALVHYKIGVENAMGLRFARLRAGASATLMELLDRLDQAGANAGVRTLVSDLVQHVAQKAAMAKDNLTLQDVTRVLPLLAKLAASSHDGGEGSLTVPGSTAEKTVARYQRLFSAISTAIGTEMQRGGVSAADMVSLLEGLSACHHVPSSFQQVEMVLLRMSLLQHMTLRDMTRALTAMAQLVGARQVSQGVLQAAAAMVVDAVDSKPLMPRADAFALARTLYHCHYGALPSLVVSLSHASALPTPAAAPAQDPPSKPDDAQLLASGGVLLAFAAGALPDADPMCAQLSEAARATLSEAVQLIGARADDCVACPSPVDGDLFIDLITCCAALQVPISADALAPLESKINGGWSRASGGAPRDGVLHSLCTPRLAVSVLESLEALGLCEVSATYDATSRYVARALSQLAAPPGMESVSLVGLLPDDAEVAVRVLYLRHQGAADARRAAATVVEQEVVRLDAALERGTAQRSGRTQPLQSFEQRALQQREDAARLEEVLLRYCTAIQHAANSATTQQQ